MKLKYLLMAAALVFLAAAAVPALADDPAKTAYWVEQYKKPDVGLDQYWLTQDSAAASKGPTIAKIVPLPGNDDPVATAEAVKAAKAPTAGTFILNGAYAHPEVPPEQYAFGHVIYAL